MSDKYNDEFLEWLKSRENDTDDNDSPKDDLISEEKQIYNEDRAEEEFIEDKDFTLNKEFNFNESLNSNKDFSDSKQNNEYNSTNNFNKEEKRSKLNDEYVNKIYVDKNYVDEQIKKNKPRFRFVKAVALVLVGAILGSFMGPAIGNRFFASEKRNGNIAHTNQAVNINSVEENNIENAVAKKAIRSVVGIHTSFLSESSLFSGLQKQSEGIGSGVIVSKDGYILTNAHVIGNNPEKISVRFADNTDAPAKVVYKDTALDLAVIKVEKKNLPAIEFADSNKVEIGDKAIAIGNPLGFNLQSTLTSGYISGLDRTITMQGGTTMNGLIQTDASINSGNSGGALLNSKGQLIGINTAKAGNTDGIGFAIPSSIAKNIVDQIIEKGSFSPIVLGIRGIDLNIYKQYTANNDIALDNGVVVGEVERNSSAAKAGIKPRDIITSIDDTKIESMNKLKQTLIKYRVGDTAKITVNRNGKNTVLNIKFEGEKPNI